MIRSAPWANASRIPRLTNDSSSRATPSSSGSPPNVCTCAATVYELASRIWPGPGAWPGGTTSLPVARIATRGRRTTATSIHPTAASMPISCGRNTLPGCNTTWPACTSSPACRTFAPAGGAIRISTSSPSGHCPEPAEGRVSSKRTTVSAPAGTGAPVIMRIAWPGPTATSGTYPAATSPTTRSRTGAWATSAPRTA